MPGGVEEVVDSGVDVGVLLAVLLLHAVLLPILCRSEALTRPVRDIFNLLEFHQFPGRKRRFLRQNAPVLRQEC